MRTIWTPQGQVEVNDDPCVRCNIRPSDWENLTFAERENGWADHNFTQNTGGRLCPICSEWLADR